MKLGKKIDPIEVKRCFVISDYAKKQSAEEAKNKVLAMSEAQLDKYILRKSPKRLRIYNRLQWHVGTVQTDEVGVWRGAGGLPNDWTRNSVQDAGRALSKTLKEKTENIFLKKRSRIAIPAILSNKLLLDQKEKYLYPIVVPGGMFRQRGLPKMQGDIEDGSMRSVALAATGKKTIRAYIGVRKEKNKK